MSNQSELPQQNNNQYDQYEIEGENIIMKSIDENVLAGYNTGIEKNRLHIDFGLIEFARTKEILMEHLPKPPATIYDIGGGYGEYSWWLTSLGYELYFMGMHLTKV